MAVTTKISWTESTWNPWLGCTAVSAGCKHCYAESSMAVKMRRGGPVVWGAGKPRARTLGWDEPLSLDRKAREENRVIPVFPSLCDVFDADPAQRETLDAWRDDFFDLIAKTPNLVWLILTKRPHIAAEPRWSERIAACGANLWIGVSAENQATADSRVPTLLEIPAKHRFISAEPLLGPLDLRLWLSELDWVIVGGESGPRARKMDVAWARQVRDHCEEMKSLFFFKQIGGRDGEHGGDCLDGTRIQQTPNFAAGVRGSVQAKPRRGLLTVAELEAQALEKYKREQETGLDDAALNHIQELEETVRKGLSASIEAAKALHLLKTKYPQHWQRFGTFEEYCFQRWDYRRTHAYRLANAGEFIADLEASDEESPIGDKGRGPWYPRNEGQIRPILQLKSREDRIQCWRSIVAEKPATELTGRLVTRKTRQHAKQHGIAIGEPRQVLSETQRARQALARFSSAVADLPVAQAQAIQQLVSKIETILV